MNLFVVRAVNALGKPFGINPFPRAFESAGKGRDRQKVFDSIYREHGWPSDESRSGCGSETERTKAYSRTLQRLLEHLRLSSIFDAPCGDLNWILPVVEGLDYIGGDISPTLIADLRTKYPHIDIRSFDICTDEFPEADVWHCRDCLFHLPFADIQKAFANFSRSKIPYALLTTHRARLHTNLDVAVGGFRYLDLERPPISLPKPASYLPDFRKGLDFPRYVGLWTRQQVATAAGV